MGSRLHCVGVDTLITTSWWSTTRLVGYFAICYILLHLLMLSFFFLHDGAFRQAGIEDGCIYIQSIMVIHTCTHT